MCNKKIRCSSNVSFIWLSWLMPLTHLGCHERVLKVIFQKQSQPKRISARFFPEFFPGFFPEYVHTQSPNIHEK
jgi:hypothetical protein